MKRTIATAVLVSLSLFGSAVHAASDVDRDAVFEMVSEAIRNADCEGQPCIGLAGIGPIDGADFIIAPVVRRIPAAPSASVHGGSIEPPPVESPRDPPSAEPPSIFSRVTRFVKMAFGRLASLALLLEAWSLARDEIEDFLSKISNEERAYFEYILSCAPDSARRIENGTELTLYCPSE